MGIKFDVFYDRVILAETSEFSKFFTSSEPIQIIHDILKISHDTEVDLSPTNNRHVLWDELRDGKALFVSINKPKSIEFATENLRAQIGSLPPIPERGRLRNEIKTVCEQAINMVKGGNISSLDFKKIKNRLIGPRTSGKPSILDSTKTIYADKTSLLDAINKFVEAIKPGNYILIKRVALGSSTKWATPSTPPEERRFPVRPETDKTAKVFGQEYVVWRFDGEKLVEKERLETNATLAFRKYFTGWGDRDFYVIEDKSFQKIMRHPFVSQKNLRFEKILPLDEESVTSFVDTNLQRFRKIINNEIETISAQLKKQLHADIEKMDIASSDIAKKIEEYREALNYLNQEVLRINQQTLFSDFIVKDINLNLNDYIVIDSSTPFEPFDPFSMRDKTLQNIEDWKILNKQQGISKVKSISTGGVYGDKPRESVKIRSKANRKNIQTVDPLEFSKQNDISQYEMFDANYNRWVPVDPNYIEKYNSNNVAIAFPDMRSYNDFVRKFILFSLRNIVKRPAAKKVASLLSRISF